MTCCESGLAVFAQQEECVYCDTVFVHSYEPCAFGFHFISHFFLYIYSSALFGEELVWFVLNTSLLEQGSQTNQKHEKVRELKKMQLSGSVKVMDFYCLVKVL